MPNSRVEGQPAGGGCRPGTTSSANKDGALAAKANVITAVNTARRVYFKALSCPNGRDARGFPPDALYCASKPT